MKAFIDYLLHKFGYIPEKELILRSLPKDKQRKARNIIKRLNSLQSVANIGECYSLTKELASTFKEVSQSKGLSRHSKDAVQLIGSTDYQGFRPAMARLYNLFANPFGVYAFVARHHWAVKTSLAIIRDEISSDGFSLKAAKGVTKKRLKEVHDIVKDLKLAQLRLNMITHLELYGNCWVKPIKSAKEKYNLKLELLAPPKLLPIIDTTSDQIVGWDYYNGKSSEKFTLKDLYHMYLYSVDNYREIGDVPLGPALIPIEADMAADGYNNQQFQTGGLFGLVFSVEVPQSDDPLSEDSYDVVEEFQDRLDSQYSGMKAANKPLVMNNLKTVHNLGSAKNLDMAYQTLHQETAKTIAFCLGVPSEKIGVSRSQTLQYIPSLVEDSVNSAFDKTLNNLTTLVDTFINEKILKDKLGITDIKLVAGGRFGALTKNAADTIKTLADAGPILTVNDALDKVLGWETLPPDNPRGSYVLDNTVNRDAEAVPQAIDPDKPDMDLVKKVSSNDFLSLAREISSGTFEKKEVITDNDNEIVNELKLKGSNIKYFKFSR